MTPHEWIISLNIKLQQEVNILQLTTLCNLMISTGMKLLIRSDIVFTIEGQLKCLNLYLNDN